MFCVALGGDADARGRLARRRPGWVNRIAPPLMLRRDSYGI